MISEVEFQELVAFGKEMNKMLDSKSDEKISWLRCDIKSDLGISLQQQFAILISDIYIDKNINDREELKKRCIHVANYCMMIWSLTS